MKGKVARSGDFSFHVNPDKTPTRSRKKEKSLKWAFFSYTLLHNSKKSCTFAAGL